MRYLQTREMTPRGEVMTLVGMGRLLLEGSEVNRLDLQNVYKVPYLTKNHPLIQKYALHICSSSYDFKSFHFFPYLKVPQTVQFLSSYTKYFILTFS